MTHRQNDPIAHIKAHIPLTPELEASLHDLMRERHFRRGETITALSEMRNHALYIKQGSARVYYIFAGKEHTYSFAFTDQFITIAHRLLNVPDGNMTIEFLEPTDVVFLSHSSTHRVFEESNTDTEEIYLFTLTAMLEHSRELEERIMVLQTADAAGRYRWVLKKYPRLLERATITQVASFLGVTKETLYRIRSGKYK
ncbi:MAG: Crp/Fnr family transcriptional regulator [Muribaculaceae bacterium]|nr:Crp/Fnr family transcriptional regulator [Muribaculaceae bacterium]